MHFQNKIHQVITVITVAFFSAVVCISGTPKSSGDSSNKIARAEYYQIPEETTVTTTETTQTTTQRTSATTVTTTTTTATETTTETTTTTKYFSDEEAYEVAKVVKNEIGGSNNQNQKDAVVWCICNRLDTGYKSYYSTLIDVISDPDQFAYSPGTTPTQSDIDTAYRVLEAWNEEKNGRENLSSPRIIPLEYTYFYGDGTNNHFHTASYNDEIIPQ